MKLHEVVIMIIVISMVVTGALSYLGVMQENYGKTVDTSGLNETSARLTTHNKLSTELRGNISDVNLDEGEVSGFTAPYRLIASAWKGIKLMFTSWGTAETMVTETATGIQENANIKIPQYVSLGISAIISVMLVAMLIYAFFKWRIEV